MRAHQIMTRDVITVRPNTTIEEAAKLRRAKTILEHLREVCLGCEKSDPRCARHDSWGLWRCGIISERLSSLAAERESKTSRELGLHNVTAELLLT